MTSFPKSSQHDVSRSLDLYEQAGELIPGWTQLISRRADQFAHGASPIYAQRAKGSRFIDVDENEYIDWMSAVGASHPGPCGRCCRRGCQRSRSTAAASSPPTARSNWNWPRNSTIRFPVRRWCATAKGGGDACAIAVRIARGTTGRDKILFCGYHGWHDWYQAANYGVNPESGEYPFAGIEPIGVPKALAGHSHPLRLRRSGDVGRAARRTRR